jgi:hypothetical protein
MNPKRFSACSQSSGWFGHDRLFCGIELLLVKFSKRDKPDLRISLKQTVNVKLTGSQHGRAAAMLRVRAE